MRCKSFLLLFCLVCLAGQAAADALSAPQLTSNQALFLSGPSAESFNQIARSYWNAYINDSTTGYMLSKGPDQTMNIWGNQFYNSFSTPVRRAGTSFSAGGAGASGIAAALWNSMMLERDTIYRFNTGRSWAFTPGQTNSSFSMVDQRGVYNPGQSQGMIITQVISTKFNQ